MITSVLWLLIKRRHLQAFPSRMSFEGFESYRMQFVICHCETVPSSMMQWKRSHTLQLTLSHWPQLVALHKQKLLQVSMVLGVGLRWKERKKVFHVFARFKVNWMMCSSVTSADEAVRSSVHLINNKHRVWLYNTAVEKDWNLTAGTAFSLHAHL